MGEGFGGLFLCIRGCHVGRYVYKSSKVTDFSRFSCNRLQGIGVENISFAAGSIVPMEYSFVVKEPEPAVNLALRKTRPMGNYNLRT